LTQRQRAVLLQFQVFFSWVSTCDWWHRHF